MAVLAYSCGNDNETTAAALQEAPAAFVPPVDGRVLPAQVERFIQAQEALTRVTEVFLDSAQGEEDSERLAALRQGLELSKEKVARRFGLRGYEEYQWILSETQKSPANSEVFKSKRVVVLP